LSCFSADLLFSYRQVFREILKKRRAATSKKKSGEKASLRVSNEHFEPDFNAA